MFLMNIFLLYIEMALLRPSDDIQYVDAQKDTKDWSIHNPIDDLDPWYTVFSPTSTLFSLELVMNSWLSL